MKAKKIRRLSMDLTKDRGGHVKILSPSIVIRSDDPDFVSDGTYVTLTWPQTGRIVGPPWIVDTSIRDGQ